MKPPSSTIVAGRRLHGQSTPVQPFMRTGAHGRTCRPFQLVSVDSSRFAVAAGSARPARQSVGIADDRLPAAQLDCSAILLFAEHSIHRCA